MRALQKLNPIYRIGERNILCPYYRECLDLAVAKSWLFWSCADCPHKRESEVMSDGIMSTPDFLHVYNLPKTISLIDS